jgi:oxygen-dependent protoporphyrinogen oxidase
VVAPPSHVAVLGGGIAGLTAAYRLRQQGCRVTLVEASDRLGGKLRAGSVAGVSLDVGADVFLARVPEALGLVGELGLSDQLVTPATTTAYVWSRGALRELPEGGLLGVPVSVRSLRRTGALTRGEVRRAARDLVRGGPSLQGDVGVGHLVEARLGRAVVDRLVDPMLGGVYAGRADDLSLEATMPQLAAAVRDGGSLLRRLRAARADAPREEGPVFHSLRGGTAALADALGRQLEHRDVLTRTRAALVERVGRGWRVTLSGGHALIVDGVVVATPGPDAARVLRGVAPAAAAELASIDYADVAIVALAYPLSSATLPAGSGFLVPAVEGRTVKAVTLTTQKWPHLADGEHTVVRCSVGRAGEPPGSDDSALVDAVHADLVALLGVSAEPGDSLVTRWAPALPQYSVGHRQRVARIDAALAGQPTVAVAGAAYDGVGIPACIRSAEAAVAKVLSPRSA